MLEGPHNIEAEQSLLGSILAGNGAYHRVAGFLKAEHFADPIHRRLFEAVARTIDGGRAATPITLKTHIEQDPELLAKGGMAYVAGLVTASAGAVDPEQHGRDVADLHQRRS
jgi:replicative DNA helicase